MESYSIAFLDLENPQIDTNIVVLRIPTARDTRHDTLTSSMTSSRDEKMSSVESTALENYSIEFLDLKNLENDTNKVAVRLLQPEIEYMTLWRHVWRHHVTSKC